ncbi:MAG TPA: phosphatidylinositol-specific phospholipase C/glycerophosphodiester phosphodiesterase family protein [Verrucomicrobiae bacterium]|nr:phosphatidylinositol-specific phospholipase C/glycerophosphodiester phosphodiesterase family protein [Verrucomicrobiae bacterium]
MTLVRFFIAFVCGITTVAQTALPRAHAHNDYEHARPLLDALDQGFGSVEADIYLVDGQLLVAHNREDVKRERTLEKLYLAPLKQRFDQRKEILPGLNSLILLVDIKDEAVATYQLLEKQLENYKPMLTLFEAEKITTNAVTIILSGNRPREYVGKLPKRWVAIDGRLADLADNPAPSLIPLISDNWTLHFSWKGGALAEDQRAKLDEVVKKTHQQGRLLRFWAIPDREEAWALLHDANVDLINTDRLAELAAFLTARQKSP